MKKLSVLFCLLLASFAAFSFSHAQAGFIVSKSRLMQPNANLLPYHVAYLATVERDLPYPYASNYTLTISPYLVCNTQCPHIRIARPSTLVVTAQYYSSCNTFLTTASAPYHFADVVNASISDNYAWGCYPPAAAPLTATITHFNGVSEYLVGVRIR